MRWIVEIKNSGLQKRNLKKLLYEVGFTLLDTEEGIAFTSDEINEYNSPQEVYHVAKKLRAALTGPSLIDPNFRLGDVVEVNVNPQRHHVIMELLPVSYELTFAPLELKVSPSKGLSSEQKKNWEITKKEKEDKDKFKRQKTRLVASYLNSKADKVMELCARISLTGTDVYKIYELLEGESDRKQFHIIYGIKKEEFDSFKDAVHNEKVTGDWARHIREDKLNSENPMTKKEAIRFIKDLAERWLENIQ